MRRLLSRILSGCLLCTAGLAWAAPAGGGVGPWLQRIDAQVTPGWQGSFLRDCAALLPPDHALNNTRLALTVKIAVSRTGALQEVRALTSSGQPALDQAALEVVHASGPWPAPPADALSDDGRAHVVWPFARDPRITGQRAELVRVTWPADRLVPSLLARRQPRQALERLALSLTTPDGRRLALSREVATELLLSVLPAAGPAGLAAAAQVRDPRVGLVLRDRLAASEGAERRALVRALSSQPDPANRSLLRGLLTDPTVASDAAAGLARAGDTATAWRAVQGWLAEPARRGDALATLTEVGLPQSVPTLAAMARDPSPLVRASALTALGAAARGRTGAATDSLRRALSDDVAAVRVAALRGLTRAGLEGAQAKALFYRAIPLVKDPDRAVRAAALSAMAATGGERALADLLSLSRTLKHPTEQVGATRALLLLAHPDADARLARMATSPTPAVAAAARWALAQRGQADGAEAAPTAGRFRALIATQGAAPAVRALAQAVRQAQGPDGTAQVLGAWLQALPAQRARAGGLALR